MPKYTINGVVYNSPTELSDADLEELAGGVAAPQAAPAAPVTTAEQMVGLGSPIARVVKGAIANPLLAINQAGGAVIGGLGQKIENVTGPNAVTGFLQDVGKQSSNVVNQYEQATQQARKRIGSEGFDFYELGGALVSPANRVLPGTPVTQAATGAMLNPVVGENLTPF